MDPDEKPHALHTLMGIEAVLSVAPDAIQEVAADDVFQRSVVRIAVVVDDVRYRTNPSTRFVVAWSSGVVVAPNKLLAVRRNIINDTPCTSAEPQRIFASTGARLLANRVPDRISQQQGACSAGVPPASKRLRGSLLTADFARYPAGTPTQPGPLHRSPEPGLHVEPRLPGRLGVGTELRGRTAGARPRRVFAQGRRNPPFWLS
eukprot:TRINITY_DN30046_c0_g1_i2.p1 TRINITY_DN30046_c0_g1~~TRINITY_DN30046_c0_g1_i2.p1  ORF type:complete len:212 (+),score=25.60 TRINITY_DN30046_c0_g1_i2:25-636(+)